MFTEGTTNKDIKIDNMNLNTNNKIIKNYHLSTLDNTFQSELQKIIEIQNKKKSNYENFLLGKPTISLHNLMIDLQKSSLSIQLAVQIRNKIVSAYQEIMNMQV